MSGHLMTWARTQVYQAFPNLTQGQRFTLLLLADNGGWDDETQSWTAFPSQQTLANEQGTSVKTVRRHLDALEAKGIIGRTRNMKQSGALGVNIYFFNLAVVEKPIVKPGYFPGNSRGDILSPRPSEAHESKRGHFVPSVDNSGQGDTSVPSEGTPVSRPAREVYARASSNPQLNPQSSSSSHAGELSAPAAESRDDDEKNPVGEEKPTQPPSGGGPELATTRSLHHGVDLKRLERELVTHLGCELEISELREFVDEMLNRATGTVRRPNGYVLSTVTNPSNRDSAQAVTAQILAKRARGTSEQKSAVCPIPAHADRGHYRHNCPDCRGLTGECEFPPALSREVFDQLPENHQRNVIACGVSVSQHVSIQTMSTTEPRVKDPFRLVPA